MIQASMPIPPPRQFDEAYNIHILHAYAEQICILLGGLEPHEPRRSMRFDAMTSTRAGRLTMLIEWQARWMLSSFHGLKLIRP